MNILFSDGVMLHADETVEDLQRGGMRLIQKRHGFRFGTDSVLLAAFTASLVTGSASRQVRAAELGAGCGAVSVLLAARMSGISICAVEIDPDSVDVLRRNIVLNGLENRIFPVKADVRDLADRRWQGTGLPAEPVPGLCSGCADLVFVNPPYLVPAHHHGSPDEDRQTHSSHENPAYRQSQARTEQSLPLDAWLAAASWLLKPKGTLVMVHRPHRLADIMARLGQHRLEARILRLVQPLPERAPSVLLMSAMKDGKPGGFKVEKPLIIAEKPGVMTDETAALYGHEPVMDRVQLYQGLILTKTQEK